MCWLVAERFCDGIIRPALVLDGWMDGWMGVSMMIPPILPLYQLPKLAGGNMNVMDARDAIVTFRIGERGRERYR